MLKMIAVEMSDQCIMKPKCPFCYVDDIQKLKKRSDDEYFKSWRYVIGNIIKKSGTPENEITVCLEYNGYEIGEIRDLWMIPRETHVTMTTMPMVVSDIFAGFISKRIEAVALSYDEFKCRTIEIWAEKALILKKHGLKVSCNYLLTDIALQELLMHSINEKPSAIESILKTTEQLNLLSLKPTEEYEDSIKKALIIVIERLKSQLPVTLDNCLGVQLGYTDKCHAGDEFIHLLSDGTPVLCCFQEKCYLWGKQDENLPKM
jgi:hypothetical protein